MGGLAKNFGLPRCSISHVPKPRPPSIQAHSTLSKRHKHTFELSRGGLLCRSENQRQTKSKPVVQYTPKARKVAPVPQEVPIVHSSAYLLQKSKSSTPASQPLSPNKTNESSDDGQQNAVQWALRQADAYFDKVEKDDTQESTRVLVKNPAVQATMKGMQGVTTIGAATAPHLAKAALPVGKKLLSMSVDVLVAGVSALNDASKKSKASKKDKN